MPVQKNKEYIININDMTCSSCVANVEKTILSLDGVSKTAVNLIEKTAFVVGGQAQNVVDAIIEKGYDAHLSVKKKAINDYLINFNNTKKEVLNDILNKHQEIHQHTFIETQSDAKNTLQLELTTSLPPAQLLFLFKQKNIVI